jgi:hypothetical protein
LSTKAKSASSSKRTSVRSNFRDAGRHSFSHPDVSYSNLAELAFPHTSSRDDMALLSMSKNSSPPPKPTLLPKQTSLAESSTFLTQHSERQVSFQSDSCTWKTILTKWHKSWNKETRNAISLISYSINENETSLITFFIFSSGSCRQIDKWKRSNWWNIVNERESISFLSTRSALESWERSISQGCWRWGFLFNWTRLRFSFGSDGLYQ